jgi:glycosyltransferase involved in cell wall biosynthesis
MPHVITNNAPSPSSRFSVVITCHNQAAFIADAVESALTQRSPAREVIVVDDGSTDSSREILSRYAGDISFIKLDANRGANAARNIGALRASAPYLVFLDGDDLLLPWALEVYGRLLAAKDARIILSVLSFFSGAANNHHVDEPKAIEFCDYPRLIEKDRSYRASASAIVIERDTFFAAGGWTEQIFPMEDLDLIAKLGYCGRTIQILAPPTKKYRMHPGNTVGQVRACVGMLQCVIQRTKNGVYANPDHPKFPSYALVGGPAWFWVKRTLKAGYYVDGLKLLAHSWAMILAGALRRFSDKVNPRSLVHPVQLLDLNSNITVSR